MFMFARLGSLGIRLSDQPLQFKRHSGSHVNLIDGTLIKNTWKTSISACSSGDINM